MIADRRYYRLYAPEGLDTKFLSQSQRLVDLLKAANFQKIYLPCESIDDRYLVQLNRRHVKLVDFVRAARMCEKAGFEMRNMDVNAFVLYGLPGERLDEVVKTALFVSEIVGSIIPMLFTPVPSTALYQQYLPYFQERGWDTDLHMLNGKLYPFLHLNEGSVNDYVDVQRFMYMLNAQYRSRSFQLFGDTAVAQAFRDNMRNGFAEFVQGYKQLGDDAVLEDNDGPSSRRTSSEPMEGRVHILQGPTGSRSAYSMPTSRKFVRAKAKVD